LHARSDLFLSAFTLFSLSELCLNCPLGGIHALFFDLSIKTIEFLSLIFFLLSSSSSPFFLLLLLLLLFLLLLLLPSSFFILRTLRAYGCNRCWFLYSRHAALLLWRSLHLFFSRSFFFFAADEDDDALHFLRPSGEGVNGRFDCEQHFARLGKFHSSIRRAAKKKRVNNFEKKKRSRKYNRHQPWHEATRNHNSGDKSSLRPWSNAWSITADAPPVFGEPKRVCKEASELCVLVFFSSQYNAT